MKLEIWMIVGVGVVFAAGLGAVTVLLLALHAEVRRLAKHAEAAQQALVSNLRQTLTQASSPVISRKTSIALASRPATVEWQPAETARAQPDHVRPLTVLVTAPAASSRTLPAPVGKAAEASGNGVDAAGWNADRRVLVMRLSSRGKSPSQIAAALRIPEDEVDLFLHVNKPVPD